MNFSGLRKKNNSCNVKARHFNLIVNIYLYLFSSGWLILKYGLSSILKKKKNVLRCVSVDLHCWLISKLALALTLVSGLVQPEIEMLVSISDGAVEKYEVLNRYSEERHRGSTSYPDPDPLFPNVDQRIRIRIHYHGKVDPRILIRIHFYQMWIPGSGSGSGSTSKREFRNAALNPHVRLLFGWSVCPDFLKGREVTHPCSFRRIVIIIMTLLKYEENLFFSFCLVNCTKKFK